MALRTHNDRMFRPRCLVLAAAIALQAAFCARSHAEDSKPETLTVQQSLERLEKQYPKTDGNISPVVAQFKLLLGRDELKAMQNVTLHSMPDGTIAHIELKKPPASFIFVPPQGQDTKFKEQFPSGLSLQTNTKPPAQYKFDDKANPPSLVKVEDLNLPLIKNVPSLKVLQGLKWDGNSVLQEVEGKEPALVGHIKRDDSAPENIKARNRPGEDIPAGLQKGDLYWKDKRLYRHEGEGEKAKEMGYLVSDNERLVFYHAGHEPNEEGTHDKRENWQLYGTNEKGEILHLGRYDDFHLVQKTGEKSHVMNIEGQGRRLDLTPSIKKDEQTYHVDRVNNKVTEKEKADLLKFKQELPGRSDDSVKRYQYASTLAGRYHDEEHGGRIYIVRDGAAGPVQRSEPPKPRNLPQVKSKEEKSLPAPEERTTQLPPGTRSRGMGGEQRESPVPGSTGEKRDSSSGSSSGSDDDPNGPPNKNRRSPFPSPNGTGGRSQFPSGKTEEKVVPNSGATQTRQRSAPLTEQQQKDLKAALQELESTGEKMGQGISQLAKVPDWMKKSGQDLAQRLSDMWDHIGGKSTEPPEPELQLDENPDPKKKSDQGGIIFPDNETKKVKDDKSGEPVREEPFAGDMGGKKSGGSQGGGNKVPDTGLGGTRPVSPEREENPSGKDGKFVADQRASGKIQSKAGPEPEDKPESKDEDIPRLQKKKKDDAPQADPAKEQERKERQAEFQRKLKDVADSVKKWFEDKTAELKAEKQKADAAAEKKRQEELAEKKRREELAEKKRQEDAAAKRKRRIDDYWKRDQELVEDAAKAAKELDKELSKKEHMVNKNVPDFVRNRLPEDRQKFVDNTRALVDIQDLLQKAADETRNPNRKRALIGAAYKRAKDAGLDDWAERLKPPDWPEN